MDLQNNMLNRPKCENCGGEAYICAYRMMLCGDCVLLIQSKLNQKQSQMIRDMLAETDAS